ncbi:hypothetical protein ABID95_001113 [Streptomyces atratus]|uniref:hypothetical protein n=1 Tax=Streptomyces atratus TaxID=1893 RepID=UPI003390DC1B
MLKLYGALAYRSGGDLQHGDLAAGGRARPSKGEREPSERASSDRRVGAQPVGPRLTRCVRELLVLDQALRPTAVTVRKPGRRPHHPIAPPL